MKFDFGVPKTECILFFVDSQELADQAAFMVKVTYTNIQTPVVTIDDAIQKKSFFPLPQLPTIDVGDADREYIYMLSLSFGKLRMNPCPFVKNRINYQGKVTL